MSCAGRSTSKNVDYHVTWVTESHVTPHGSGRLIMLEVMSFLDASGGQGRDWLRAEAL